MRTNVGVAAAAALLVWVVVVWHGAPLAVTELADSQNCMVNAVFEAADISIRVDCSKVTLFDLTRRTEHYDHIFQWAPGDSMPDFVVGGVHELARRTPKPRPGWTPQELENISTTCAAGRFGRGGDTGMYFDPFEVSTGIISLWNKRSVSMKEYLRWIDEDANYNVGERICRALIKLDINSDANVSLEEAEELATEKLKYTARHGTTAHFERLHGAMACQGTSCTAEFVDVMCNNTGLYSCPGGDEPYEQQYTRFNCNDFSSGFEGDFVGLSTFGNMLICNVCHACAEATATAPPDAAMLARLDVAIGMELLRQKGVPPAAAAARVPQPTRSVWTAGGGVFPTSGAADSSCFPMGGDGDLALLYRFVLGDVCAAELEGRCLFDRAAYVIVIAAAAALVAVAVVAGATGRPPHTAVLAVVLAPLATLPIVAVVHAAAAVNSPVAATDTAALAGVGAKLLSQTPLSPADDGVLMRLGTTPIDRPGQCGHQWPESASAAMAVLSSDHHAAGERAKAGPSPMFPNDEQWRELLLRAAALLEYRVEMTAFVWLRAVVPVAAVAAAVAVELWSTGAN